MKILVVQIGKIGDMVLTTPLFREIHRHFPGARVNALVSHRGAPVIRGNPNVSKILVYRKDPLRLLFLLIKLRFTQYDFLIDPKDHFSTESALLARMSGAKITIGFNKAENTVFSRPLPAREENYAMHAAARNLLPLKLMGISKSLSDRPELFPDPILQTGICERYGALKGKTILLNISAGDACRLWEEQKWREVAGICLKKGFQVFLSFQPKDAAMAGNIQRQQPGVILFHSASIRDMVALVPLVSLVVTPDTSIVHIASAFNIPQVALFPPVEWNLNKFRPLSDLSVVVQPKEGEAIAAIRAEDVVRAVETIVNQKS
jgi:heptosyltransferase III